MSTSEHLERLFELLLARGYRRAEGEPFTLASGKRSEHYFNGKEIVLTQVGMVAFARWALEHPVFSEPSRPVAVGGMELGAVPMGCAIAALAPFPLDSFIVRKQSKAYGTRSRIEGRLAPGARVVVVEDVITTGGSTRQAVDLLQDAGVEVAAILCLVDRDLDRDPGDDALDPHRHLVHPAFTLSAIAPKLPS
jgi:orotate phosphoribosyltransferase